MIKMSGQKDLVKIAFILSNHSFSGQQFRNDEKVLSYLISKIILKLSSISKIVRDKIVFEALFFAGHEHFYADLINFAECNLHNKKCIKLSFKFHGNFFK